MNWEADLEKEGAKMVPGEQVRFPERFTDKNWNAYSSKRHRNMMEKKYIKWAPMETHPKNLRSQRHVWFFQACEAFLLYDSHGFPLDLTEQMALEAGLSVDVAGFEAREIVVWHVVQSIVEKIGGLWCCLSKLRCLSFSSHVWRCYSN